MKTAVIYSSKHGTTEKIANYIAEKLTKTNEVELFSLKKITSLDISRYDKIILGTPIYAGQPVKNMKNFCKTNESILLQKKICLFICGMEPTKEQQEKELKEAFPETLIKSAAITSFLGGEFLFEKMNFLEKFIIKKIVKTKTSSSRIDWESVENIILKFNDINIS